MDSSVHSDMSERENVIYFSHPIPTLIGYRPISVISERPPHCRKTIRRDNKVVQALTLPRITNYNMRSLFPKLGNFARDMIERESDISFLTEVWQKQENKNTSLSWKSYLK